MWNWDWCSLAGTLSSSPRWQHDERELYVDKDFESQSPANTDGLASLAFQTVSGFRSEAAQQCCVKTAGDGFRLTERSYAGIDAAQTNVLLGGLKPTRLFLDNAHLSVTSLERTEDA
jgi:hypothetical protein